MSDLVSRLHEIRRVSERGSYVGTSEVLWLLDEIGRLRAALERYGAHFEDCPQRPCECGFLQAWQDAALPATIGEALRGGK